MQHPYRGKTAVAETMHGKQQVIAPVLRKQPGLEVIVPENPDTDRLGTFSGEVERQGSMLDTAIAKARMEMDLTGLKLGIASEGSFGPHPQVPFMAAGVELLVLVDDERGLVITEQQVFADTNYAHATGRSVAELSAFAETAGFPAHALIVRPNQTPRAGCLIHKGIRQPDQLEEAVVECAAASADGLALVQTDMRAHMNPGRMAAIAVLAGRFATRIATLCPACASPGHGPSDSITGLPCEWCGEPSTMVRWIIHSCAACGHEARLPRPDGLLRSDPMHCLSCNP